MNIWLITTGEPLPSIKERPHRTGILSKMLSNNGHMVTWWTTTFDHQTKSYLKISDVNKKFPFQINLEFLHSNTSYKKNISVRRLINHRKVSLDFIKKAKSKKKPDIIYCSFPTIDLSYQAVKFGLNNKIPVFIDIRDLWPDIFLNPFPKLLKPFVKILLWKYFNITKYIFKNCNGITAVSEKYLKFGLDYGCKIKSSKESVFPLGFDSEGQNSIDNTGYNFKNLNIKTKHFNVWFVGTFGSTYDLSTVIKVAKMIEKTHPDVKFIFTGDGEKMVLWKKQAKLLKNIIFTGWVGKHELLYISSKSSLGLMAYSKGAPQGLPNKVFEYMSSGLPILSSLQTETKILIDNEKIGLNYMPNNPDDLLLKLLKLVENKELLEQMRKNSIKTYSQKFNSSIIYKNLIKFLEKNKN